MDFFAFVSLGFYPTPGATGAARAMFFDSLGLLGVAPIGSGTSRWASILSGMNGLIGG